MDLGSILDELGSILAELGLTLSPLRDRFSCFSDVPLFLLITRAQKRRLAKKLAKHMVFPCFSVVSLFFRFLSWRTASVTKVSNPQALHH